MKLLCLVLCLLGGLWIVRGDSLIVHETYTEYLTNDSAGDVILAGRTSRSFNMALTFPEAGCTHFPAKTRIGLNLAGEDAFQFSLGTADNLPNKEYTRILRDESDQPYGTVTIRRAFSTLYLSGHFTVSGQPVEMFQLDEPDPGRVVGGAVARVWWGDFSVERLVIFRGKRVVTTVKLGEDQTVDLQTITINGASDYSRPIVSVAFPRAERLFTNSIQLRGAVRDHLGEVTVYSSLNGTNLSEVGAEETGAWSLPIELVPGTNTISIWAINSVGNVSATNTLRLFRVVTAPFELSWDEGGSVIGLTDGQMLEIGRGYRLTARPAAGKRFGGWNGGSSDTPIHSPNAVLNFLMEPGMTLHASFIPPVFMPLTLDVPAGNSVLGVTHGQLLEVGRSYQAIAQPGPSNAFLHWSGSIASSNATLRFVMESNLVLQAHFAPNPWRAIAGYYVGLLLDGPQDSRDPPLNSGTFVLTLTANGRFSGKLRLRNQAPAPFSGRVGLDGVATVTVMRPGCPEPMQWLLYFDVENSSEGRLLGESSSPWTSGFLLAMRREGGPAYAGRYTFRIGGSEVGPAGDGAGSLNVDRQGKVIMTGSLGDGTPFTLATVISRAGTIPIHVPLYADGGFLQGQFIASTNGIRIPAIDTAECSWFKPAESGDRYFPEGFQVQCIVEAIRYTPPPPGSNALPWTNGVVSLFGGELPELIESAILIQSNTVFVAENPAGVSVTLSPRTGLFTTRLTHPVAGSVVTGKGALLQYDLLESPDYPPSGAGWFRGIHQSGYIRLLPTTPPNP